jgi:hypothetical protein
MIKLLERSNGKVFGIESVGKITAEDIEKISVPLQEGINKYGKINWIFIVKDFKGTMNCAHLFRQLLPNLGI